MEGRRGEDAASCQASRQASKQARRRPRKSRGTILLVDDDPLLHQAFERLIDGSWTLVSARSVGEGRAHLRSGLRFVAVIVDAQLPDGSGVDVLRLAREVHPCVSILAQTAHGQDGDFANAAYEVGAEYARKHPSARQVLLRRLIVRQHLSDERVVRAVDGWAVSHRLSPRETEVLALAMLDRSYKETADAMSVGLDCVRGFERAIKRKSKMALSAIVCGLRRELRAAA